MLNLRSTLRVAIPSIAIVVMAAAQGNSHTSLTTNRISIAAAIILVLGAVVFWPSVRQAAGNE